MRSSISRVLLSLIFASVVFGSPVSQKSSNKSKKNGRVSMGSASGTSVGAVYFLTNEPSGNFIVAADIGQNGQLTLREAISTGGVGSHGNDGGKNGPDALFSQGAIKASAAGEVLAAVNPGSNTISVFKIDPNNPFNLQRIGDPVGSGGEFPVSLALNKAGDSVCVLNGGEVNTVSCFNIDKNNGVTPISGSNRSLGLNQTTPATGPAGSVSHIVFSEDGSQLVASIKGDPTTNTVGFLATFDVAQDNSLSQNFKPVSPGAGGLLPFSLTVVQGKNAILATDAGVGFDIFDFTDDSKSSVVPITNQSATCWSSFSPKTGNFYLTDIGTSIVTEVNIDDNLKGTIVNQYPQGSNSSTIDNDVASVGNNDFLYVLSAGAQAIDVSALVAPGKANHIQRVDIAGPAKKAGLTVSAAHLQGITSFIKK